MRNKNYLKKKAGRIQWVILAMLLSGFINAGAQIPACYTLDSLQSMARNRNPLSKQLFLATRYGEEAVKNANTNWLPKASFVGTATYQSEVTRVSLPSGLNISVGEPAMDQYKAGFEMSQLLFDGGSTSTLKSIERLNVISETEKTEADLLKLTAGVNDLFTAILINRESFKILNYLHADLNERKKNLESAVESGLVLITAKRELEAEIVGVEQKIIENKSQLMTLYSVLSIQVQEKIDTSAVLVFAPDMDADISDDASNRPEYKQLTTQMELFDLRRELVSRSILPKMSLFGNGYYGRSGLNFFNNDFRFYGIAGIGLSWNLGGNYTSVHQKRQLRVAKEIVENQRTLFELGVQKQLEQQALEIQKIAQLIEKDDEIAAIRSEVKQTAAIQLESGVIVASDYVSKLDAESQALLNRNIHKIQLAMAYEKYKTIIGK